MFVLASRNLFWWPVTVLVPDPVEAGRVVKQSFEVRFEAQQQETALAIEDEMAALSLADATRRRNEQLATIVKDWRQVTDANGTELPFSADAFHQAMQFAWFRTGVWQAYQEAVSGGPATAPARLGN